MLNHCGKLKNEYKRLAQLTTGRIPGTFFANKADVMGDIVKVMHETLELRTQKLIIGLDNAKLSKTLPKDLRDLIIQFIPM